MRDLGANGEAPCLAVNLGAASSHGHALCSLEIDCRGSAAMAIVHSLRCARNDPHMKQRHLVHGFDLRSLLVGGRGLRSGVVLGQAYATGKRKNTKDTKKIFHSSILEC